jgi:hypothetical protein
MKYNINNKQRANGITGGIISIILGIILLAVTFPYIFLASTLIVAATSGLYFLFKTIRNAVKAHLDKEELSRQYMNKMYREAKDNTANKHKIEP